MQLTSSDATGSICALETDTILPCDQRQQHYVLQQAPLTYIPSFSSTTMSPSILTQDIAGVHGGQVELMSRGGGQDEQHSDSGRGASDEEIMFQAPSLHPMLCAISASNGSSAGTDAFGRKISPPINGKTEKIFERQLSNAL